MGFKERYHRDVEFSVKVRCFSALSLLPMDDVVDGFDGLADDEDLPQELVSYFEACYIGSERGRGNRRRRIAPLFPMMYGIYVRELWKISLAPIII